MRGGRIGWLGEEASRKDKETPHGITTLGSRLGVVVYHQPLKWAGDDDGGDTVGG